MFRCKWVLTWVYTSGDNISKAFRSLYFYIFVLIFLEAYIFKFMMTRRNFCHLNLFKKDWENVWFPCANKEFWSKTDFQPLNIFFHMGDTHFLFLSKKVLPANKGTMMKYWFLPNAKDISHNFHLPMENWGYARSVFDVHSTSVAEFSPVWSLKPQMYSLYTQYICTDILRCLYTEKDTYANTIQYTLLAFAP